MIASHLTTRNTTAINNTNTTTNNKQKIKEPTDTIMESPLFNQSTSDENAIMDNSKEMNFTGTEDQATTYSSGALLSDFDDDDKFELETKLSRLGSRSQTDSDAAPAAAVVTTSPLDARDLSGCTPLLVASQYGHADLAAFLIKRGADYFALDNNKDSALHWGAYKGEISVVGLLCHLLSSSSSTTTTNSSITTHGNASSSLSILSLVDAPDSFGQTPIHLAALRGNCDVLEYLLDEVEVVSMKHGTNNNHHRRSNSTFMATSLLRPFLRVFSTSRKGRELYKAVATTEESNHQFSPKILLQMKDNDSRTPLDLVVKYKRSTTEIVLKEWYNRYNIRSGFFCLLVQRCCCFLHDGFKLFTIGILKKV